MTKSRNRKEAKVRVLAAFFLGLAAFVNPAHAACNNPSGTVGDMIYNNDYAVFQGCTPTGWQSFHKPVCPTGDSCDVCAGSPSPGDTCADGTIYAGLSPDGNVKMYTTPADAGTFTWNNGTSNWIDTAMSNTSYTTGEANTTLLVGLSDAASPYAAAVHCDGLTAHGHSDWYLPARDELDVLYDNLVDQNGDNTPGGPLGSTFGFNVTGSFPAGWYWSSSESNIQQCEDPEVQ